MIDASLLNALYVEAVFILGLMLGRWWRKRPRRKNWQRPRGEGGRFMRRDGC
jgi:hypothetical protein